MPPSACKRPRLGDSALAQIGLLLMMVKSPATHLGMCRKSREACMKLPGPEDWQCCMSSIGNTLYCQRKAGPWAGPHLTTLADQMIYRPAQHLSAVDPLPGLRAVSHLNACLLRFIKVAAAASTFGDP